MLQIPEIKGKPWAILPKTLETYLDYCLENYSFNIDIESKVATRYKQIKGNIAVLSLSGPISQKMDFWTTVFGGTSTEQFGQEFDSAINDKDVGTVIIEADSPGGSRRRLHIGLQALQMKLLLHHQARPGASGFWRRIQIFPKLLPRRV
jgi:hypothetical protein